MRISRRSVVAALPLLGCAGEANAKLNTIHITPDGEGDGSSWENAAGIYDIPDLISQMAPDGEVLIAADRGAYELTRPIEIDRGGQADHAIRIRGVSSETGEAMSAQLRGDRPAQSREEEGTEGFRLLRGASHLHFSHFAFSAIGNGAIRVAAPVSGLTIEDCTFENLYRFLENTTGDGEGHASLRGFAVRRVRGTGAERGFLRIRYNSTDGLIEDCAAVGTVNQGGFIPAGCALDDRASRITYRRCVMENFQQLNAGDYWNGDGFSDEPGNNGIRYESCEARGSTDGGFDCKSRDVVLENCVAEDNKRNFRIWSDRGTMTSCTSRNPNFRGRAVEDASPCHLWIGGDEGSLVRIADLTVEDSDATPIIEFEHDVGRVEIRGFTIHSPRVNWGNDENRVRQTMLIGEAG